MSDSPTWSDKQHESRDVTVTLSVSDALQLKQSLPLMLRALEERGPRQPEDREQHRAASAAVAVLLEGLTGSLRPYDVPAEAQAEGEGSVR